ncbi:hypothetical protein [Kitasatospora sp. NPDC097643]|uniref:bpX5 domain-containing protein n=1 Tax=Kitasatospora sp. NPDC097643 TaxID=3157230 RepID=UPI00332AA160
MTTAALRWERREPPLPAAAVLALGADVPALAAATRDLILAGHRLSVAAADDFALLVVGAEAALPWVDGARYLGLDGGLLVPTTARPWPAASLWRSALRVRESQLGVLVPGHALVTEIPVPVGDPAVLEPYLYPHPHLDPHPDTHREPHPGEVAR